MRTIKTQGNYMSHRDGSRVAGFALAEDRQLFLAAPALLAALRQLMEWDSDEPGWYQSQQRADEVWADCEAAIATATGQARED